MAQGDLAKYINNAKKIIEKDSEYFRTYFNVRTQTYQFSAAGLLANLVAQFGPDVFNSLPEDSLARIRDACTEYGAIVLSKLKNKSKTKSEVTITGNAENFSATVRPLSTPSVINERRQRAAGDIYYAPGSTDAFRLISDARKEAKVALYKVLEDEIGYKKGNRGILELEHAQTGVADKQRDMAFRYLARAVNRNQEVAKVAAQEARLSILSKYVGSNKQIEVMLSEGSQKENQSKSSSEARRKAEALQLLKSVVEDNDWINQKGSDSYLESIRKELINAAVKKGAKGQKLRRIDRKANKASAKLVGKSSNTTVREEDFKEKIKIRVQPRPVFNSSLIALLNAKLPPAVRANMTGARLHSRTGRFSESAKVVDITPTPQGYPSVAYTYQRSPYDVFDPVLGKDPWNTPSRDPKTLIEKSIRDIARDLAIGRFYVRRA